MAVLAEMGGGDVLISKDKQMRFLFHEDDRQMQLSPKIVVCIV